MSNKGFRFRVSLTLTLSTLKIWEGGRGP